VDYVHVIQAASDYFCGQPPVTAIHVMVCLFGREERRKSDKRRKEKHDPDTGFTSIVQTSISKPGK